MSENWNKVKLGELIEYKKGFAFKSNLYRKNGCLIVRVSNFTHNSIDLSECLFLDESEKEKFNDVQINQDDIVIATVGSWQNNPASIVGKVIKVPRKADGALLNQNAVRMRANASLIQSFLYYTLKDKNFSDYLLSGAQGSANQASITLKLIFDYDVNLPPIEEQRRIAEILSALDEKIELNLQMNRTLEKIAQTTFKYWFVDFQFPGFDGKLVNGLPKGWRLGKLGEIVSFVKGKKPNDISENFKENYLPQILIDTFNTGKSVYANSEKMVISTSKDLIMVMDGASSGRIETGFGGIVGSTLAKIHIKQSFYYPMFVFNFLKTKESDIMGNTTGSSIPHADKSKILNYSLVFPPLKVTQEFERIAKSLNEKIVLNKKENQILSQIRDGLLPKLMSGKIRVPEV